MGKRLNDLCDRYETALRHQRLSRKPRTWNNRIDAIEMDMVDCAMRGSDADMVRATNLIDQRSVQLDILLRSDVRNGR